MTNSQEMPSRQELIKFFHFLYEDTEGYVYLGRKDHNKKANEPGYWTKEFFHWPTDVDKLVRTCLVRGISSDTYISPSLFREQAATKAAWLGTRVLWAEFDNGAPKQLPPGIPNPALRIRSSTPDHEHWYWKLGYFETSAEVLEQCTRRIAYGLGADLGTWNRNRVLRPPTTIHYESQLRVSVLSENDGYVNLADFAALPDPPQGDMEIPNEIPDVNDVTLKYPFSDYMIRIFRTRKVPVGQRSSTLSHLSHLCMETGMRDNEVMAMLLNADDRWEKFVGRDDRLQQLTNIIATTRLRHPELDDSSDDQLKLVDVISFITSSEHKFEWAVNGLLPKQAIACLVSKPGLGKTQLSLDLAIQMALGKNWLGHRVTDRFKIVFVSLEMHNSMLREYMKTMLYGLSEDERDILTDNFMLLPVGENLFLDGSKDQKRLLAALDNFSPDGIFVDSLSRSTHESTSDEKPMEDAFAFYRKELLKNRKAFVWMIHHFRKATADNKKPNKLDDVKGAGVIIESANLVVSLWKERPEVIDDPITVRVLKSHMAPPEAEFDILRTNNLRFIRKDAAKLEGQNGVGVFF